jgi:hypothetical protein
MLCSSGQALGSFLFFSISPFLFIRTIRYLDSKGQIRPAEIRFLVTVCVCALSCWSSGVMLESRVGKDRKLQRTKALGARENKKNKDKDTKEGKYQGDQVDRRAGLDVTTSGRKGTKASA